MLPTLSYGDAVGNDTIAIQHALLDRGYEAVIYAELIDRRFENENIKSIEDWVSPKKDDVIIYHLSIGWKNIDLIRKAKCKKIAIYHNITPTVFNENYDVNAYKSCKYGLEEVKKMSDVFDYCLADSEFNKQDLLSLGYTCPIDVLPVMVAFDDYKKKPAQSIIKKYSGKSGANILFVGRVAPNKKHEDIIAAFSLYKKYYDKNARLFLIGNYAKRDIYFRRLRDYVKSLDVQDVYFSGHIKFHDILAYYSIADLFVCMSEHEGFCVPLLEAMYFEVPIIAYDSTAIPDTLGDAGVLVKEKNYAEIAGLMNRLITDQNLRKTLIDKEQERLKNFNNEKIRNMLYQYIEKFIGK